MTDNTGSDINFDNLYRVLVSCFVIILCGYLAGRTGLITGSQSSGLGVFVSKFSLPALLMKSMIELDFSKVNWMFLVSVIIAKSALFILVVVVTLLVKHPFNLGYAGIFAIFVVQSNDLAIGYPILEALYGESHKEYLSYLYLVIPVSIVVLNPIGFTLLEIQKTITRRKEESIENSDGNTKISGIGAALLRVLKGIVTNPIIVMTFLGIIGHFVFDGTVPPYLVDILSSLGKAFGPSALFLLGLSMVGKIKGNLGMSLLVPFLLITAKTIITPLVTWELVGSLLPSHNGSYSLSMFGFIYGTLPTSPSVFLYATNYQTAVDVISKGIVIGTFLAAPIMFASGKMVTIVVTEDMNHEEDLTQVCFDISIISLIASIWVLIIFIVGRRWRMVPHRFTFSLIVAQIISCCAMIAYYARARHDPECIKHYPIIILLLVGTFAARVWTAVISVIMCLKLTHRVDSILRFQGWFWVIGWGLPIFLTGLTFMVGGHNRHVREMDPTFHFGLYQVIISAGLLCICIMVTISSIVVWQRNERREKRAAMKASLRASSSGRVPTTHESFDDDPEPLSKDTAYNNIGHQTNVSTISYKDTDQEDIVSFPSSPTPGSEESIQRIDGELIRENGIGNGTTCIQRCGTSRHHRCNKQLNNFADHDSLGDDPATPVDFEGYLSFSDDSMEKHQSNHHLVMLLVLLFSMFVGIVLCTWRIINSESSGIYLEIEFLDSFLLYGQGLIFLALFGFDTKLVLAPLKLRVKQWIEFMGSIGSSESSSKQESKTEIICRQFTQFHQENCIKDIVTDMRLGSVLHENTFYGNELCDWLMEAGLAKDKEEAIDYGRHLLQGRVICPVTEEQDFQDAPHYYRFLHDDADNKY